MENYFRLGGREDPSGLSAGIKRLGGSTWTEPRTSINKLEAFGKRQCDLETGKAKMLGCWTSKIWVRNMLHHLPTCPVPCTPHPWDFSVIRYSGEKQCLHLDGRTDLNWSMSHVTPLPFWILSAMFPTLYSNIFPFLRNFFPLTLTPLTLIFQ